MPDSLAWISDELDTLDALSLRRHLQTHEGPQTATLTINQQSFINFGANDYLGLAADDQISSAAIAAIQTEGWGSGASPLVTGHGHSHALLETKLAEFEQTEAALIFPSGFAANMGVITALAGKGDIIFSDEKNHASIIDGSRLSGARVSVYPHLDVDYLENLLSQALPFRRRLIVTDSLFSMDGDLARLPELVALAEKYDAMLMVDEAHATGVFGEQGRGVCEHFQVEEQIPIRVGTFSKALGGHGGFAVGSQALIDWLANRARSYVFSTAAPMAGSAAMIQALEIVKTEPQRRQELLKQSNQLRQSLKQQGWNTGASQSQIIPVYIGQPDPTMKATHYLREQGLLVPGIRPPSVPEGESLLRISLSYAHTPEMIERLIAAMSEIRSELV
ncbi:MAG: 8-amino-7-oxononanoate synthase [Pirellulales bacterium]